MPPYSGKSLIAILLEVLNTAFPVKTLAAGLVLGFTWYIYSKTRKEISEAERAENTEKMMEEHSQEQGGDAFKRIQYRHQ